MNTAIRQSNLRQVPEQFKSTILDLERHYGHVCFLPLDTPVIYDERIVDWFFDHCQAITKIRADVADTEYGYSLFNSINVYIDPSYARPSPIWSDNPYPDFEREFPHFYQQLMDLLPVARIPRLAFWNSTKPIAPHRDQTCMLDMPNSFRVMITDSNPASTLYVQEETENYSGEKLYVPRLSDTNSFVWNNLRVVHGSDYTPGYRKILLLVNDFIPNFRRYTDMLDRSMSKYADSALTSTQTISAFIDA